MSKEKLLELSDILKEFKPQKHHQQKVSGIEMVVEICNSNECFCLLLTKTRLIDISRSYEYDLTEEEYMKIKAITVKKELDE
ncbi:MAG: hypothetical protein J5I47_10950 [Vicingus serpentipes]|nr:hypothetical protein [Vicingus serpentipes]